MYTDHGSFIQRDEDGACIPINLLNADYAAYLTWLSDGNIPGAPPEPTHAQLWERAIAEMRAQRQPILDVLDGLQSSALVLGQTSRAQVIETAKQGLRDITKLNLSECTTYEEMQQTVMAAYFALAAALPSDIRLLFKEATQ